MSFSFFSLFKKQSTPHKTACDCAKLQEYASALSLRSYEGVTLYHLNSRISIPFLLFDPRRGLYIFDYLPWSYEAMRDVKAVKANSRTRKAKDVNVDEANELIRHKLQNLPKDEQCPVENFLYLPYLTKEEYDTLDESLKTLLPVSRLIFVDDSFETIHTKLSRAIPTRDQMLHSDDILAALFVQYTVHSDGIVSQLTPQQKRYLHAELPERSLLYGGAGSGKSSVILLKALVEKLSHPELTIMIVESTVVASELMTQKLLDIIDQAMINVDPSAIRILTPEQIAREHYIKLYKKPPVVDGNITDKMLRHSYTLADMLFCDDMQLLDERYLTYLRHMQLHAGLHYVALDNTLGLKAAYTLPHEFRSPHSIGHYCRHKGEIIASQHIHIMKGNAFIHTLHSLEHIFEAGNVPSKDILVVTYDETLSENLKEEIETFFGFNSELFDPHKSLLNQDMEQLLIVNAGILSGLQRPYVIIIHDGRFEHEPLSHMISRSSNHVYLIEQESKHEKNH